jgi:hypothetical protein
MSASALLLHRKLIGTAGRGWRPAATTHGDPAPELTQTAPLGNVSTGWNPSKSQNVNADSGANPERAESPHYSPAEQRKPTHA